MVQAFFPGLKDAEITPHFKWKQFFMLNHRLLTYNGESVSVELLLRIMQQYATESKALLAQVHEGVEQMVREGKLRGMQVQLAFPNALPRCRECA